MVYSKVNILMLFYIKYRDGQVCDQMTEFMSEEPQSTGEWRLEKGAYSLRVVLNGCC